MKLKNQKHERAKRKAVAQIAAANAPHVETAKKELADIIASITRFDRRCKANEYTDVGDVWEVLYNNRSRARRALRALGRAAS